MMKNKIVLIIAAVLIVVILVFVGIGVSKKKKEAEQIKTGTEQITTVQEKATEAIKEAATNPAEKIPSANPYEKVVNPFRDAYKNPFSR